MKIFRREIEVIYELIKAENEVFLESILKKIENNRGNLLKDIYQSAKEKNTVTVRVKGRVRARDVRDTEGNLNDLTLSDPENSSGKKAYNITQTLHATNEAKKEGNIEDGGVVNNEAKNDEIRVRNDGVGGDGVGGDGVGGDGNEVVEGAENCIRNIFVLDKGGGSTLM